MTDHPWFKFYPTDWRADQMLRLCSAAARGLWLECMCLMHEARPYGHLLVNGRAVTDAQLAKLAGILPREIGGLIAELEAAGVFSRDENGVIFSRRMTRDAARSAAGSLYGKRGGNPALRTGPRDKGEDKGEVKGEVKGDPAPRVQNQNPESLRRSLIFPDPLRTRTPGRRSRKKPRGNRRSASRPSA